MQNKILSISILLLFFLIPLQLSAESVNLRNGMIRYYPFAIGEGDWSGKEKHGERGGQKPTTDRFGNINSAYYFDGINDYIKTPPLDDTDTITISLWIYIDSLKDSPMPVISEGDLAITLQNNNKTHFKTKDGDTLYLNDSDIPIGEWFNIVCIADSINHKKEIFINNVKKAEKNWYGTANNGSHTNMNIGFDNDIFFQGKIDDIRIYNRTLTSLELNALYTFGNDKCSEVNPQLCNKIDCNKCIPRFWFNGKCYYFDFRYYLETYYPFDGDAKNFCGEWNNGKIYGATLTNDRFENKDGAYSFDGEDDYIEGEGLGDYDSITISVWVFINSLDDNVQFLFFDGVLSEDKYLSFNFQKNNNSCFRTKDDDTLCLKDSDIPIGEWFNIVLIADSVNNKKQIFINNVKKTEKNWYGTANNGFQNHLYIGKLSDGNYDSNYFKGKIDDFRIYGRALTKQEIEFLYNYENIKKEEFIIYKEDFNFDPGYVSFSSEYAYCDNTSHNYYINKYWAYSVPFPIVFPSEYNIGVSFDILFENQENDAIPEIFFFYANPDSTKVDIDNISQSFSIEKLKICSSDEYNECYSIQDNLIKENTWYTISILTKDNGESADIVIKDKATGEIVENFNNVDFNIDKFNYIGFGYKNSYTPFRIDNIKIENLSMKNCLLSSKYWYNNSCENSPPELFDGLFAYYPFNGDVNDYSGLWHNGEINGNIEYKKGIDDYCIYFNDSSANVTLKSLNDIQKSFTISAWIKPDNIFQGEQSIFRIGKDKPIYNFIWMGGGLAFGINYYSSYNYLWCEIPFEEEMISEDDFYFVSAVYNYSKGTVTLFLNGKKIGGCMYHENNFFTDQPVFLGFSNEWEQFKGCIDNFYLYNRALSDKEIEELYNYTVKETENTNLSFNEEEYELIASTSDDNQKKEFTVFLKNKKTGNMEEIDDYKIILPLKTIGVELLGNSVISSINTNIFAIIQFGNLEKIIDLNFSVLPDNFTNVNIQSYKDSPQMLIVNHGYRDALTNDINSQPKYTRWYKITNFKPNTLYNFIYQLDENKKDKIVVLSGGKVFYKLYRDNGNGLEFIGSKEFDPAKGFTLPLVFEKGYNYFVEFSINSKVLKTYYKLALMEVMNSVPTGEYIYFNKIFLKDNGTTNMDIIIPESTTYEFILKSNDNISSYLTIRDKKISIGKNQIVPLKAGIYNLSIIGVPKSSLYFIVKKADISFEQESNSNVFNATAYKKVPIKGKIGLNDNDTFIFKNNGDKLNFTIELSSVTDKNSVFRIALIDTSGKLINADYQYPDAKKITTGDILSQYNLIKEKNYYLKISILSTSQDYFDYLLTINNADYVITKEEEYFNKLYNEWKDKLRKIKLDNNLNTETEYQKIDTGSLIIITGDSDNVNDALWKASQELSKTMYNRFLLRGFTDDDIYWVNANTEVDVDSDGVSDNIIDSNNLSIKNFQEILDNETNNGKKGPLYIYLVDHGANNAFKFSSKDIDGDGKMEILYSSELKNMLDNFQNTSGRKVILIIEACKSGSFVDDLDESNRVIITSSSDNELSYIDATGGVSFTKFLADSFLSGKSIQDSYESAKNKLIEIGGIYLKQHPLISNEAEESLFSLKVGGSFASAGMELTEITDYWGKGVDSIDLSQTDKLELYVQVNAGAAIKNVWAVVLPPNFIPPQVGENEFETPDLAPYTVELTWDPVNKKYEGDFDLSSYKYNGEIALTYYVEDNDGNVVTKSLKLETINGTDLTCNEEDLLYCKTQDSCEGAGGYWYNNECNTTPQQSYGSGKLQIKSGWNLLGLPVDISVTMEKFNKEEINTIWKWENGSWAIWSPKESIQSIIKNYSISEIDTINSGEGFWINATNKIDINVGEGSEYGVEKLNIKSGWNLLGTGKDINVAEFSDYKTVWKWSGSSWQIWSPNSAIMDLISNYNIEPIKILEKGVGFWINN